MVGQTKLIAEIDSKTIDTFPHNSLFVGPLGCGKHTLISNISSKFDIPLVDITEMLNEDYLNDLLLDPTIKLYLIDADKIDLKQQGKLISILDDPNIKSFIAVTISNDRWLTNSIKWRCQRFTFSTYTKEELSNFLPVGIEDPDFAIAIARTPGTIKNLNNNTVHKLKVISENMTFKLIDANFANMLTILDELNYGDEPDKIDVLLFFAALAYAYSLKAKAIAENAQLADDYYIQTTSYYYSLANNAIMNKKQLVERYLIDIWNHAVRQA